MAEHRDIDYVRIFRIDDDARDGLRILETHPGKGLAGIGRLVNAVTKARTLAIIRLACSHPDNIRIRQRDRYIADGSSCVSVKTRLEGRAIVRGFPVATGS